MSLFSHSFFVHEAGFADALADRDVGVQAAVVDELLATGGALELAAVRVLDEVALEVDVTGEALAAFVTRVREDAPMDVHVHLPAELS